MSHGKFHTSYISLVDWDYIITTMSKPHVVARHSPNSTIIGTENILTTAPNVQQ